MATPPSWIATRPDEGIDVDAVLERWWGLTARSIESLPSERDRNLLIQPDAGAPTVVLKIANLAEEPAFLECQGLAAARLATAGLPVARPIPALDGRTVVGLGDPGPPWARLLPWLPGRPLATIDAASNAVLADLGRVLGRVTAALAGFDHPASHRLLQWDVLRAVEVVGANLADVQDSDRRALLMRTLDVLTTRLVPVLPRLRTSLIHNDANDHNVLVDDAGERITGLLDFGDLLHSVTAHEIAVAAAYAMFHRDDRVSVLGPLLGAFDAAFALAPEEIEAVPDLIVARLATSVAISAHQGRLDPDPYLRVSEGPGWALLAQLDAIGPAALRRAAHEAVGR